MKNKKIILIAVICIILIAATTGGLYLLNKKQAAAAANPASPAVTPGATGTTTTNDAYPLKNGSKGPNVKALQVKMNDWMAQNWNNLINIKPRYQSGPMKGMAMTSISEDGSFGPNTQEFAGFVFGSIIVTEAQYNTMGAPISTGTTSSWDDSQVPDKEADQSYWDYWVANIGKFF